MVHLKRLVISIAVGSLGLAYQSLYAQDSGVATVRVTTDTGERDASVSAYREYGNPATLDFIVSLDNATSTPFTLPFSALTQRLRITVLLNVNPVVVSTQWSQDLFRGGIATAIAINEPFTTRPGEAWDVRMSIQRSDGQPFQTGRYTLRFFTSDVFNAALDDSGNRWQGRFMPGGGDMFLEVGPPRGIPREQARAFHQEGQRALKAGRQSDALSAFRRAATADSSDIPTLIDLGTLCIQLRLFSDAISPLERALNLFSRLGSVRTSAYRSLAMAYLGVNDETNAARVLRQGGEGAQVPQVIQQLRAKLPQR
jgi:hypothetical protein